MGEAARKIELSYQDYLALEKETDLRHEFLHGVAWAMAGGTVEHSALKSNLMMAVGAALRGHPCRPYDSDLKIHIEDTGLFTYPDLTVICGKVLRSSQDANALTNPSLLVEVLSPSTESWDRGAKFAHYRRVPTLSYYLLVSLEPRRVELYARQPDGRWMLSEHGPGEQIELPSLEISISVDEIYADLPEAPAA